MTEGFDSWWGAFIRRFLSRFVDFLVLFCPPGKDTFFLDLSLVYSLHISGSRTSCETISLRFLQDTLHKVDLRLDCAGFQVSGAWSFLLLISKFAGSFVL